MICADSMFDVLLKFSFLKLNTVSFKQKYLHHIRVTDGVRSHRPHCSFEGHQSPYNYHSSVLFKLNFSQYTLVKHKHCYWLYCNNVCFLRNSLQRAMASSPSRFLDHTQRRTTVGRTPLDEWLARRRDLYLTTYNTHNRQTSIPPVGFEPTISAGERPQTYALDRTATGTGTVTIGELKYNMSKLSLEV